MLELLDRFTYQDETENSAIFRLLTDTLSRLASKRTHGWSFVYEMRLLDHPDSARNSSNVPTADARFLRKTSFSRLALGRDLSALWAGIA